MNLLKKTYRLVAVLAIAHLFALGGGIAYLVSAGKLDADRARAVVDVFRAQSDEGAAESGTVSTDGTSSDRDAQPSSSGSIGEEIRRRSLEREYMQADHRLILANRQMTEVRRRQEEFERREARLVAQRERLAEEETKEGFQRDLEIVSMLKPKVAVDTILARPIDDAARMMLEMEPRKSKKIMETANKDPRKWARMLAIQERLREMSGEKTPTQGAAVKR